MALAHLLTPALFVEGDPPNRQRIGKISLMRIVKADVSVLPKADKSEVDGPGGNQPGIASALGVGIGRVPGEVVNFAGQDAIRKSGTDPIAEAGGMRIRQSDILVDMEYFDEAPIDFAMPHQFGDHFQLGITGGYQDTRGAVLADAPFQNRGCLRGGRRSQSLLVRKYADREIAGSEFGHAHIVTPGSDSRGRHAIH